MKKKMKNTRLQFLILAVSLLITTTVLGLSAYLNDQDEFSTRFTVVSKDDFQINITGEKYDGEVIFAGSSLDIIPTITHVGDAYPAYVFAKIELDKNTFRIDDDGINSDWQKLSGTEDVYYYGTSDGGLAPFTSTESSTLFGSVNVKDNASSNNSAKIAVTVYAIQTMGYNATDPSSVWGDAYVKVSTTSSAGGLP